MRGMDERYGNIIDKGWARMSDSLDDNLPVKSNKLNFIPGRKFYYSAALILILIGSMLITVNNSARLSNLMNISEKSYLTIIKSDNNIISEKSFPKDNFKSKVTGIEDADKLIAYGEDTDHKISQASILKNKSVTVNSSNALPLLPFPKITNNCLIDKSTDNDEFFNNVLTDNKSEIDLNKNNFRHNVISISVNSVNEDLSSIGGLDGSINYAYKMNKNLGFMTGIEHSMFSKNRMNIELENYNNEALPMLVTNAAGIKDERENTDNSIEDRLYYVGIPLGVMYSFNKFTLSAGVKFSYLLNNIYDTDHNSYFANNALIDLADNEQYSPRIYNKFDYSLIFGFEFHVVKDFSIFSKFNLAYANIMNSYTYQQNDIGNLFMTSGIDNLYKERMDKNIYFGLGIKYDIKKK